MPKKIGNRSNGNKSNVKAIDSSERQRLALQLRKKGLPFRVIAEQLGYKSASGAHETVRKAIADIPREAADELRQIEMERLDEMMASIWDEALAGQVFAIDRVIKIMDRRAKMLGIDTSPTGNPLDGLELNRLDGDDLATFRRLVDKLAAR